MRMHKHLLKLVFGKAALATAALSGFLLFAGAPSAQAHDWYKCQRRIEKAEWKLEEAIERHGYYSRQAYHWRSKLADERERCWREHRRWWDDRRHCWRYDRDWDDDRDD